MPIFAIGTFEKKLEIFTEQKSLSAASYADDGGACGFVSQETSPGGVT